MAAPLQPSASGNLLVPGGYDKILIADTDWLRATRVDAALSDMGGSRVLMTCDSGRDVQAVMRDVVAATRQGTRTLVVANMFVGLRGFDGVDGVFPSLLNVNGAAAVDQLVVSCWEYTYIQADVLAEKGIPEGPWKFVHYVQNDPEEFTRQVREKSLQALTIRM